MREQEAAEGFGGLRSDSSRAAARPARRRTAPHAIRCSPSSGVSAGYVSIMRGRTAARCRGRCRRCRSPAPTIRRWRAITRSHCRSPFDVVERERACGRRERSVTRGVEPDLDAFRRANVTSASRTSLALVRSRKQLAGFLLERERDMRDRLSKKARCSCSGHARSMPRSRCGGRVGDEAFGREHRRQDVAAAAAADQDLAAAVFGAFDQRDARAGCAANAAATRPAAPAPITATAGTDITPGPQKAQIAQVYDIVRFSVSAGALAVGFTVKSGWAAAVLIAGTAAAPRVVDSRRVEISDPDVPDSTQPYHAGFGTARDAGDELKRLVSSVKSYGRKSVTALLREYQKQRRAPRRRRGRRQPDRSEDDRQRSHPHPRDGRTVVSHRGDRRGREERIEVRGRAASAICTPRRRKR